MSYLYFILKDKYYTFAQTGVTTSHHIGINVRMLKATCKLTLYTRDMVIPRAGLNVVGLTSCLDEPIKHTIRTYT